VVPKLLGIPGVANVAIWGQRARQLQVQVDPSRLREHGVTLNQVVKSTGEALWVSPLSYLESSMPGAGGWIDTPNQRLGIQHKQPISTAAELAKVAVEGASLSLGDVARVVEEHPPLIGDAIVKNGPGLLLVVEKFPQANTAQVIRDVEAALHELGRGMPGIDVDSHIFRAASFADAAADNLKLAGTIGTVLLVLVLFGMHSHWRGAMVSIAAIAMSVMVVVLVFYFRKASIDTMVLLGFVLALAALVDDAVNDVENVLAKLRQPRTGGVRSVPAIIYEALLEVRSPLIYGTLIVVLALAPVFLIGGSLGAFLSPLAITYLLALVASATVALTVTPALALVLLRKVAAGSREAPLVRWSRGGYERAISSSLGAPRRTSAIAAGVVVAGLIVAPLLTWSLIPSFKERDIRVTWQAVPGTSHPEMQRMLTQAAQGIRQTPGVRSVAAHIGRAITGDQVVGMEAAQIWVGLHGSAGHDATVAAIRQRLQDYPGLDIKVGSYFTDKLRDLMTPAADEVVVRVQGLSRATIQGEAEKIKEMLSGVAGLRNVRVGSETEAAEIEIEVDLAEAGRVGLKPGDVRRAAATVFAGLEVGNLFEQQKVFDVVVWGTPENRRSLSNIKELLIDRPDGGHVRLADVAHVRIAPAPAVIEREGITRFLDVRADVAGRNIGSVISDVEARLQKLTFPLEHHASVLRDQEERGARSWRVLIGAVIAASIIYLLVQVCLQSWRLAALFWLPLLAALAGGVLGMVLGGGTVFLGSLTGLIAVLGMAARNGILLLNRIQGLELSETAADKRMEAVLRGARERLVPVVTSAAAIVAALLPIVFLGNVAGLEILHPAVLVIITGVLASAVVNLFVVPAVYLSFANPQPAKHPVGGEQHAV
jgi:Cu/Ag efflux pump CusA